MIQQTRKSKGQSTDFVAGSSTSTQITNGADTELTNGQAPHTRRRKKKKRGRPRIHPRPEEQETEEEEEAKEEAESKDEQKEEEEPLPPKRNRPHCMFMLCFYVTSTSNPLSISKIIIHYPVDVSQILRAPIFHNYSSECQTVSWQ